VGIGAKVAGTWLFYRSLPVPAGQADAGERIVYALLNLGLIGGAPVVALP
jgi:hypothetical protein